MTPIDGDAATADTPSDAASDVEDADPSPVQVRLAGDHQGSLLSVTSSRVVPPRTAVTLRTKCRYGRQWVSTWSRVIGSNPLHVTEPLLKAAPEECDVELEFVARNGTKTRDAWCWSSATTTTSHCRGVRTTTRKGAAAVRVDNPTASPASKGRIRLLLDLLPLRELAFFHPDERIASKRYQTSVLRVRISCPDSSVHTQRIPLNREEHPRGFFTLLPIFVRAPSAEMACTVEVDFESAEHVQVKSTYASAPTVFRETSPTVTPVFRGCLREQTVGAGACRR